MTTSTTNKHIVDMPAGLEPGPRAAVCPQTAVGAGFTKGALAERWMR
ncbi:MAG: hypothetical protein KGL15_12000 [Acidobacteriota bacterium]|nr:hypothetical protein [Acidobacteriota bacterium]